MNLLFKEFWDLKWRFITLAVITVFTGYFILANQDLFKNILDINEIQDSIKRTPWLNKFIDSNIITQQIKEIINNTSLYVWSQWVAKNLFQLVLLSSIVLGFPLFAREAEHNTNSFLLSVATRRQIFWAKFSATWLALFFIVTLGCLIPAILSPFYDLDFSFYNAFKYWLHMFISAFFLHNLVLLFSIIANDVIKPVILSLISFIIIGLPGHSDILQSFNIYSYMNGSHIFLQGQVQITALLIILILSLAVTYFSWYILKNQDL